MGEDESHSLASLMETIGSFIESYENDEKKQGCGDIRFSMGMAIFDDNCILGVCGEKTCGP